MVQRKKDLDHSYILGVLNDNTEWQLDPEVLQHVTNVLGMPYIDFFASNNKRQHNYSMCTNEQSNTNSGTN